MEEDNKGNDKDKDEGGGGGKRAAARFSMIISWSFFSSSPRGLFRAAKGTHGHKATGGGGH